MRDDLAPASGGELDPFRRLRAATPARIGLGRVGDALPLAAELDLQEAHARARDAVHGRLDLDGLARALGPLPTVAVRSRAPDRSTYLRRPDLGRLVDPADAERLDGAEGAYDLALVVADGLSAAAVMAHAAPTVAAIVARLGELRVAPIVLASEARVAIGDEIGARLRAGLVAVMIGERPGLSVHDSLGIYVTADPRIGRLDSERNCISNIHGRGLGYAEAADLLVRIVDGARRLGRTGVDLKLDAAPSVAALSPPPPRARTEP